MDGHVDKVHYSQGASLLYNNRGGRYSTISLPPVSPRLVDIFLRCDYTNIKDTGVEKEGYTTV